MPNAPNAPGQEADGEAPRGGGFPSLIQTRIPARSVATNRKSTTTHHRRRSEYGSCLDGCASRCAATHPCPRARQRVRLARAALKRSVRAGDIARRRGRPRMPLGGRDHVRLRAVAQPDPLGPDEDPQVPGPLALNENRQLGRLTLRQREALAGALQDKQGDPPVDGTLQKGNLERRSGREETRAAATSLRAAAASGEPQTARAVAERARQQPGRHGEDRDRDRRARERRQAVGAGVEEHREHGQRGNAGEDQRVRLRSRRSARGSRGRARRSSRAPARRRSGSRRGRPRRRRSRGPA